MRNFATLLVGLLLTNLSLSQSDSLSNKAIRLEHPTETQIIVVQGTRVEIILKNGDNYQDELIIKNDSIIELESTLIDISEIKDFKILHSHREAKRVKNLVITGAVFTGVGATVGIVSFIALTSSFDSFFDGATLVATLIGSGVAVVGTIILAAGLINREGGQDYEAKKGWEYSIIGLE